MAGWRTRPAEGPFQGADLGVEDVFHRLLSADHPPGRGGGGTVENGSDAGRDLLPGGEHSGELRGIRAGESGSGSDLRPHPDAGGRSTADGLSRWGQSTRNVPHKVKGRDGWKVFTERNCGNVDLLLLKLVLLGPPRCLPPGLSTAALSARVSRSHAHSSAATSLD